jgi:hypothetical protein
MKNMRSLVIGVLAIALVCGVAWVLPPKRQTAQQDPPLPTVGHRSAKPLRPKASGYGTEPRMARAPAQPQPLERESPAPPRGRLRPTPGEPQIEANQIEPEAALANAETPNALPTSQDTPAAQETIQDPAAQVALGYIGGDPDAEPYWYEAINDPSLSGQESQGMTEDLNEDGLSDPEDPTMDDQP